MDGWLKKTLDFNTGDHSVSNGWFIDYNFNLYTISLIHCGNSTVNCILFKTPRSLYYLFYIYSCSMLIVFQRTIFPMRYIQVSSCILCQGLYCPPCIGNSLKVQPLIMFYKCSEFHFLSVTRRSPHIPHAQTFDSYHINVNKK